VAEGAETSAETVAFSCALARRLGRSPVVVAASPGLVAYRLVVPFLNEALRLHGEGISREEIDAAVLHFGMPVGPFRLLAEIGEPEHRRLASALAVRLGDRFLPPPTTAPPAARRAPRLTRLLSGALRRLPRPETGRGGGVERRATTADQALTRVLLGMINEAARLIEERVVPTALEVDRIVTLAIGFPADRGGLLFHADSLGASVLVETLGSLAASHGPRFEPAPLLLAMLEQDTGFHAPYTGARVRIAAAAGQPPPEVLT